MKKEFKIKLIKGRILTLDNGETVEVFYGNDGIDKVEVDGILYEVDMGNFKLIKSDFQLNGKSESR